MTRPDLHPDMQYLIAARDKQVDEMVANAAGGAGN